MRHLNYTYMYRQQVNKLHIFKAKNYITSFKIFKNEHNHIPFLKCFRYNAEGFEKRVKCTKATLSREKKY